MKRKGSRTERELLHMFFENGWGAIRTAGSGNTSELATDIVAGKNGRVLAIECKAGRAKIKRYIKKEQVDELRLFSKKFGAEPWIGMRFDNEKWLFLKINHLDISEGGHFGVNLKLAREKGLSFEELIGR